MTTQAQETNFGVLELLSQLRKKSGVNSNFLDVSKFSVPFLKASHFYIKITW